ncbi:hypothetical protein K1719_038485 [Acacia pycnantha]|nr:hypothetical protein K1719_038485 [Acacia pycnantha]
MGTASCSILIDIVMSKEEGNGMVKTIAEAIKVAPEHSNRRFIIYLRAGRYEEKDLKVGRKKTNVMLIGDGRCARASSEARKMLWMASPHSTQLLGSRRRCVAGWDRREEGDESDVSCVRHGKDVEALGKRLDGV